MYAGRVACCPLVSHVECAPRAPLRLEKRDRRTDGRQTVTLRLPLDAAGRNNYVNPTTETRFCNFLWDSDTMISTRCISIVGLPTIPVSPGTSQSTYRASRNNAVKKLAAPVTMDGWMDGYVQRLAACHSGRTPITVARSTYSWRVTTYVGKPSAIGQPIRSTQPFILSMSINWVVTNFIGCVLVAPSGECLRGWVGAVINRYAPCVAALWPA